MAEVEVDVVVQIGGEDVLAGRLWSHRRRESESATFSYTAEYLARRDAYELDPLLPLSVGAQQTPVGQPIFGAFSDCAPDRWGRRLIHRAERQRVRNAGGAERSFSEIDYLLGVRDDLRQGALRFRDPDTASYLADPTSSSATPRTPTRIYVSCGGESPSRSLPATQTTIFATTASCVPAPPAGRYRQRSTSIPTRDRHPST